MGDAVGALIGRRSELRVLRQCVEDARAGRGRVVLVSGEPGIGKTRLARELTGIALAAGVRVAWGRGVESAGAPPPAPWSEVLRALDPGAELLLGAARDDAPDERFRVVDLAVRMLARAATEAGGLVVVLDDAHWADGASLLLLRQLAARAADLPLLLVVTFRPPGSPDPWALTVGAIASLPAVERIELRGLGVEEVREQLANAHAAVDRAQLVHDVTGGNPFFVRELAAAVAIGAWDVGRPPPRTVLEVVTARVAHVAEPCAELLGLAAVAGRCVDVPLLAHASGRSVERCLDVLAEARGHGLVELSGGRGLRFVHALVRDALTASLDDGTRARHHRAIALALEARADVAAHAAALAEHWTAAAPLVGQAPGRRWSAAAAAEAVRGLAYEDAVRLYRAAVPGDGARGRGEVLLRLARAALLAGDLATCADAAREAGALAADLRDATLLARAALVMEASTDPHANATARELCDRALSWAAGMDPALRARLLAQRSHVALYGGELESTRGLSARALAAARAAGDDAALIDALRARQEARPGAEGRSERAELAEEMVAVAARAGDARAAMWGHLWAVDTLVEDGRLGDAARRAERLADAVRRVGGPVGSWLLDRCVACIAQGRGELDLASTAARRAYDGMRTLEPEAAHGYLAGLCAIAHHRGATEHGVALARTPFSSPAMFTTMRRTGRAFLLVRAGLADAAATEYELAGPAVAWRFPPFYVLPGLVIGALTAAALDRGDDLRGLLGRIEPFRGQHVVGGAGVVTYLGPVELHLGILGLRLGRRDTAIDDLVAAERSAERGGAAGYLAEARHHLSSALRARAAPGDAQRAASLADTSARTIRALGLTALVPASASVLSPREEQVADLVAQGLTNPQIAAQLVISARTAQNHVQHILTKLGFTSRSQIASWKARSPR